ncbi:MAG: hypothetical protein KAX05_07800, partial [Bacteroidales bacterium]|nr:hypothetical protein [Bacteroidales bacterium]
SYILLEGNFTIHRFEPGTEIPVEVYSSEFFNISKTDEELSIVCSGLLKALFHKYVNPQTLSRGASNINYY